MNKLEWARNISFDGMRWHYEKLHHIHNIMNDIICNYKKEIGKPPLFIHICMDPILQFPIDEIYQFYGIDHHCEYLWSNENYNFKMIISYE